MSPLEFMQAKRELKKLGQDSLDKLAGTKSVVEKIKVAHKQLNAEDTKQLEHDTDEVSSEFTDKEKKLRSLIAEIDTSKKASLESKTSAINEAVDQLSASDLACQAHLDAIGFILSEKKQCVRKVQQQNRYQINKVQKMLEAGGWGKSAAKHISTTIFNKGEFASEAAEMFDSTKIRTWAGDCKDADHIMLESIRKFFSDIVDMLTLKIASTVNQLKSNATWGGCMSPLYSSGSGLDGIKFEQGMQLELSVQLGHGPWLVAFRAHCWRYGPSAWPLPGVGSVALAKTDDIWLFLILVVGVVSGGVNLNDMASFLDTPSGSKYSEEQGKLVRLCRGDAVYIPWGWTCCPISCPSEKDDQAIGHMVVAPLYVKSWAKKVAEPALVAIADQNQKHFEKNEKARAWADRKTTMDEFMKSLV